MFGPMMMMMIIIIMMAYLAQGVLNFASALLVDVAFTGCLCQRSAGRDFYEHAMEQCYTNAPLHLQPLLIDWLQFGLADSQAVCAAMRGLMQANLKGAMQPAFETLHAAAAVIGGSVDYLRVAADCSTGRCTDFESDPFVVVLLPEPVDYFRSCGATMLCEQRCCAEITDFEGARGGRARRRRRLVRAGGGWRHAAGSPCRTHMPRWC